MVNNSELIQQGSRDFWPNVAAQSNHAQTRAKAHGPDNQQTFK
jgi:hypothetical protein